MWTPISESELLKLMQRELMDCSPDQRKLFAKHQVRPYKIAIHRLGALETVFVVAAFPEGVIYYEDVEEGFEWVHLGADGIIPYQGCNQFRLTHVLANITANACSRA